MGIWIWVRKRKRGMSNLGMLVANGSGNVTYTFSWVFYVLVSGKKERRGFGNSGIVRTTSVHIRQSSRDRT
jgi:hypothetical protein